MIVDKINTLLAAQDRTFDETVDLELECGFSQLCQTALHKLLFREDKDHRGKMFLSESGKCSRQVAYQYLGIKAKGRVIDTRSYLNFFMGDVIEALVVTLAVKAGCPLKNYGGNQQSVSIEIGGNKVTGRPDGILFDVHKGDTLLEVKSMSVFGFREFQKGGISPEYEAQVQAYMVALKLNKAIVVGVSKDLGLMHEFTMPRNVVIAVRNEENYQAVFNSEKVFPDRPQWATPNTKGYYPWQCLYCFAWKTCLPSAKLKLVGNAYKLKETTNGDNPEILPQMRKEQVNR